MTKRKYNNSLPSVTQVLSILRKIGLEMWYKKYSQEYTDAVSKKGRLVGTDIHEAIHNYIQEGKTDIETNYPLEVGNALQSFVLFRNENPNIDFTNSEMALTSEKYKFNGTLDCTAIESPSTLILADWKSGEAKDKPKPVIYDEAKAQCSAYIHLWNENNQEKINKAVIVALAKDKVAYNMYWMEKKEINQCFKQVFLSALKIYNYQKSLKKK